MRNQPLFMLLTAVLFVTVACENSESPISPADQSPTTSPSFAVETVPFLPGTSDRALPAGRGLRPAANDCDFNVKGDKMELQGDCTTDGTISIPDGMTLDGKGHTITAVDPAGDHFRGAVVKNAGSTAHVKKLVVTADGLANACDGGDDRLRGIMFEGASGSIEHSTVIGINQGPSGCQEGNAIEIRNAPFDGTHPNTVSVEVTHNQIDSYQKTGIVANGDVDVSIAHNKMGSSATQANLAANGIQLGFGATGTVEHNKLDGNQWLGASNFAATAILTFDSDGGVISHNKIAGNSDIGILVSATGGLYEHNKVDDIGPDGPHGDFGIADVVGGNEFNHNKVCGFDHPFFPDPLPGKKNKACN